VKPIFIVLCSGLLGLAASAAPAADAVALYKKSCGGCHGAQGTLTPGNSSPIKGMPRKILLDKLADYAEGKLGGPAGKPMQDAARKLSAEDRDILTEHIGKL
jgi:cytochrome c553